jgi:hypothetical protein
MKLSRKVLLVFGAVILVAALIVVGMFYFRQAGELSTLRDRLSTAQNLLPGLAASKSALEGQAGEAQALLDVGRAKFPRAPESIEYGEDFFRVAYGHNLNTMAAGAGVELIKLTASQPFDRKIGTVTYSVSSFVAIITGELDNELRFIDAIGTRINYKLDWSFQLPWSVEVKSISRTTSGAVSINLDIYAYRG